MFAVETANWNAQARMFITLPLHHVVLRLAEEPVLRAKERAKSEQIPVVSLQNMRCVFEICRNRGRMQQRSDARAAEFFRPKFAEMIERKVDAHA